MNTNTNTTRSEAYHTGYEAHEQGEARSANPYPTGSYDADEWSAGYDAAGAIMTSFHVSNFGAFGDSLPRDLDGYCHLTAEGWLAAPMDAMAHIDDEAAEALAAEAREALDAADAALDKWRAS